MIRRAGVTGTEVNLSDILADYYEWMLRMVCGEDDETERRYSALFRLLHETEFTYLLDMDDNRRSDGIDLRYRFAYEQGIDSETMRLAAKGLPCSMLEMMAALAKRCEENITDDPDVGDRTGEWFFEMIESLGLMGMDDRHFDQRRAADILARFLRREYLPSGKGGLFTVADRRCDMRDIEIWCQMMRYLNEKVYYRYDGRRGRE